MLKGLPLSGLVVLVVEDAYLIAMEAQRIVEEAGAETVLLAGRFEEARARLQETPKVDACILDLKLDETDASPLIDELLSRGISLVLATGFDTLPPNADVPVLRKPYTEIELIEALRCACGKK